MISNKRISYLVIELWVKFCDTFGTSIIHPQYIIRKLQEEAVVEAEKYAKGNLVDIGCGRMPYRKRLDPLVDSYTGVDHPKVSKLYKSDKKPEVFADARKLPFNDNSFDIGLMFQVLEHVDDPEKVVNEAARVLKPGGFLIISVPFLYPLHDMPYDVGRYTKTALAGFVDRSNLYLVKIKSQGGFFDFLAVSLNTFLAKRIKDIILSRLNLISCALLIFYVLISLPIILLNNFLSLIVRSLCGRLPSYPNYFPLDYLVIAKKKA